MLSLIENNFKYSIHTVLLHYNTLYHEYFVPNPFALITSSALLGMNFTKFWASISGIFSIHFEW